MAGKTPNIPDHGFGIVIFKARSHSSARRVVGNDPAVKNRVFRAELMPFRIALSGEKLEVGGALA